MSFRERLVERLDHGESRSKEENTKRGNADRERYAVGLVLACR